MYIEIDTYIMQHEIHTARLLATLCSSSHQQLTQNSTSVQLVNWTMSVYEIIVCIVTHIKKAVQQFWFFLRNQFLYLEIKNIL